MLKENIYLGTVLLTENNEVYQKLSPLLRISESYYVNLRSLNNLKSYLELYKYLYAKSNKPDFIISTYPNSEESMYVDVDSLVHYYDESEKTEKINVKKIKKDWHLDSRIPLGYEN